MQSCPGKHLQYIQSCIAWTVASQFAGNLAVTSLLQMDEVRLQKRSPPISGIINVTCSSSVAKPPQRPVAHFKSFPLPHWKMIPSQTFWDNMQTKWFDISHFSTVTKPFFHLLKVHIDTCLFWLKLISLWGFFVYYCRHFIYIGISYPTKIKLLFSLRPRRIHGELKNQRSKKDTAHCLS